MPRYRCYIERIEPLGNGRARLSDHRVRATGEVVSNDYQFEFGTELARGTGSILYESTGPRSYRIVLRTNGTVDFAVTREISPDGRTMTHVGQGTVGGRHVRNEQVFQRADGPARAGECSL